MIEYTSRRCYLKRQLILLLILLFGIRFSLSFGKDLSPSKFFFLKIDGEKFDKLQNFELHTQQCVKNFLMKYEIKMNFFEIYSSKFFWNEFEYYI